MDFSLTGEYTFVREKAFWYGKGWPLQPMWNQYITFNLGHSSSSVWHILITEVIKCEKMIVLLRFPDKAYCHTATLKTVTTVYVSWKAQGLSGHHFRFHICKALRNSCSSFHTFLLSLPAPWGSEASSLRSSLEQWQFYLPILNVPWCLTRTVHVLELTIVSPVCFKADRELQGRWGI